MKAKYAASITAPIARKYFVLAHMVAVMHTADPSITPISAGLTEWRLKDPSVVVQRIPVHSVSRKMLLPVRYHDAHLALPAV
jgi:hypothetical protein